ncbi:MAG TPA: hypothetical protein VIN59_02115 [Alphaproteobacteria bacterium]
MTATNLSSNAGGFQKLEGPKAKKMVDRLNMAWPGSKFEADKTALYARSMPFLHGWQLVEASDATALPEKRCVILDNGDESVALQYDAAFIQDFCRARELRLDRNTAADYVRFWLEYVRSGTEKFMLIENVDDLPWREEPTPQARKSLAKAVTPLTLTDATPALYKFHACLLFRDALFDCTLDVTYDGKITVTSRDPIVEDLTVVDSLTGF